MNPTIEKPGFVYLITCESTVRVKIGYSQNPERRLQELSTSAPGRLNIFKTWPGCYGDESAVHRRLAKYRRHLEWFEVGVEEAVRLIDAAMNESAMMSPAYNIGTMADLHYLELSQALSDLIACDAVEYQETEKGLIIQVVLCSTHHMAINPQCPLCPPKE